MKTKKIKDKGKKKVPTTSELAVDSLARCLKETEKSIALLPTPQNRIDECRKTLQAVAAVAPNLVEGLYKRMAIHAADMYLTEIAALPTPEKRMEELAKYHAMMKEIIAPKPAGVK